MSKKRLIYIFVIGIGSLIVTFLITSFTIGKDVNERCQIAQASYEGDCVEALIKYVDDENQSYRERNSAIWALGQLGDSRALTVLQKYYTGKIPEREPYDEGISQYELKKALGLVQGDINATAFVWRRGFYQ